MLIKRLLGKYGQDILIATGINRQPVICFRNTGYTILTDDWYELKKQNIEEERLCIVKAAADIIRDVIHRDKSSDAPTRFYFKSKNSR